MNFYNILLKKRLFFVTNRFDFLWTQTHPVRTFSCIKAFNAIINAACISTCIGHVLALILKHGYLPTRFHQSVQNFCFSFTVECWYGCVSEVSRDGILYLCSIVNTIIWKFTIVRQQLNMVLNLMQYNLQWIQCSTTCIGFGNSRHSLRVRLKLCHRLLHHSLASICNRTLLLSQLWVVSCKVVSQTSCVAEVFKLSSTHLTNYEGLVNSPVGFMELKMLPYGSFQRSRCWSYRFCASHCSHFVNALTRAGRYGLKIESQFFHIKLDLWF